MTFTLGAPQFLWLCLVVFVLGYDAIHHGEPKKGAAAKHDFYLSGIALLLQFGLMYWGGFFSGNGP